MCRKLDRQFKLRPRFACLLLKKLPFRKLIAPLTIALLLVGVVTWMLLSRTESLQSAVANVLVAIERADGSSLLKYMSEEEMRIGGWNETKVGAFVKITGPVRAMGWRREGDSQLENLDSQSGIMLTQFYRRGHDDRMAAVLFLTESGVRPLAPGLSAMMFNCYWSSINLSQNTRPVGLEKQKLWLSALPEISNKLKAVGIEGYVEAVAPEFKATFVSWETLEKRLVSNIERLERQNKNRNSETP